MEVQTLYDFSYSLMSSFDKSSDRATLVESFLHAMSLFFPVEELKIYLIDEYSFLLKDFEKPWENLNQSEENLLIKKYFDNFLVQKSTYEISENMLYFPIVQKNKTLGIVRLKSHQKISKDNEFFKILPLAKAQISTLTVTLKIGEMIKVSSKFHQTVRNIAKITETQYELDYILPNMGDSNYCRL